MNEISTIPKKKKIHRGILHTFWQVKTWWKDSYIWSRKWVLPRHWIWQHLNHGLPGLQNYEKLNSIVYKLPSPGNFFFFYITPHEIRHQPSIWLLGHSLTPLAGITHMGNTSWDLSTQELSYIIKWFFVLATVFWDLHTATLLFELLYMAGDNQNMKYLQNVEQQNSELTGKNAHWTYHFGK